MDEQNYINEIAFSQSVINIGADSGNDIILRGQGIADFHVMLNYASNVWHLIPLDPSYSTLVNGRGVGSEGCTVQTGAVLSIGDYRLTLSLNGINADIMVAQVASAAAGQISSAYTEESEGSSILLSLSDKLVPTEIDAGSTVEYELTVTNAGPLVANMQLQLQGIPTAWVQIIPPVLNLNEGRSGTFTVRVSPPRSSAAKAGLYQLHFVAISPNYPRETGVADTVLTILPYSDFLVNGPTPRRLSLSRSHSADYSDLIIINNSNADSNFVVRSYDDANELNFAYKQNSGNLTQGQISVTVRPGDNDRVPIRVETRKRPLIGLTSHIHHYYTSVTPMDRPGDAQTLLGEVNVRPLIHIIWLLLILLVLAVAALIFFQPYIHQFDSIAGKRTEMVVAGNSVGISWDVSRFASKITLSDGTEERQVNRQGNAFVSPSVSTTYTLKAENFISNLTSKLFGGHEKEFRVLLIPRRPSIDVFNTDTTRTNYSKPVRLDWAVSSNADSAVLTTNKQEQSLAPENYSGNQTSTYTSDALISLKASNDSGYEEKSVFVNVTPDKINLKKFIAWVRPNGIAVPSDNDTRRTTRWGSLQLYTDDTTSPQTIRQAVNPQPDAQSNSIIIPDNYAQSASSQGGVSPEQQSVNRILNNSGSSDGLLIGAYTDVLPTSTPVPVPTAVPTAMAVTGRSTVVTSSSSSSSSVSPESRSSATREFNIKLVEVIEDPLEDSGYRVIQYFPDYVLQKSEQILIEWDVDGISTVTIENLSSGGLTAAGTEFAYPEKSTNYVLNAEIGDIKKVYSLPVNVAGDIEEDKGSGENCNLKASTTTLAAPGTVMLTWTGGGNYRVQLVSSVKAEEESNEAEKKKEAEAKEKGEEYTKPKNIEMSGGVVGDYLQPSGFMRVNVDKQTTFVLNAFDGDGNVVCSKEAEIKYTGGNDKLDLKLEITKITDTNDVSQPYYTVGQTVQFTIRLSEFKKGLDPTGSVMLTDGDSSCTLTLPKDTCSMVMKHEGLRSITAVYGGDDNYNKKTASGSLMIMTKIDTETAITSALKSAENLADLVTSLKYEDDLADLYKKTPTGTITFTIGSGTCDLDLSTLKVTCGGKAVKSGDLYSLKEIILTDTNAKTVRAKYNGDDYFNASVSDPASFATVPTKLVIENAYKHSAVNIDLTTILTWDTSKDQGRTPAGSIVYRSGTAECTLDLTKKEFKECSGNVALGGDGIYHITGMAMNGNPGEYIYAEYKGDSFFDSTKSESVKFKSVPTDLGLTNAKKSSDGLIDLIAELSWSDTVPAGTKPQGTIIFSNSPSGVEFCSMDISGNTPKFSDGCTGLVKMTTNEQSVSFEITDLNTGGKAGDEIMAEYSGDDYFLAAESNAINFNKVETTLKIGEQDARKNGSDHADISAVLGWNPDDAPKDTKPTGTIKFTAGNGSCTLNIATGKMDCEPKTGKVDRSFTDHFDISVIKMLLSDNKSDRVKAEYSGDAVFNPSSSTTVKFWTIPTTVTIGTAFKPDASHVNVVDLRLNWNTDTTKGRTPQGVITLTVGSGSCALDVGTGELSGCSGTGGVPTLVEDGSNAYYKYAIRNMALSDKATLKIKASYGGDGLFLDSSSDTVDFSKVPTEIKITDAAKTEADRADIDTLLSWDAEGTEGFKPTGTIKFTVRNGSNGAGDVVTGTCTLNLSTKKLNCDSDPNNPPVVTVTDGSITSVVRKMLLPDKNADRIKAEYSGDTLFEASESTIVLFERIDTEIEITKAYKTTISNWFAEVIARLTWDLSKAKGVIPTGTITFTAIKPYNVISSGKTESKCVYDIVSNKLNCGGNISVSPDPVPNPDPGYRDFDIVGWLLEDQYADRVQVEYSGDGLFNKSTSMVELFGAGDKNDTVLLLKNAYKPTDDFAHVDALLGWEEDAGGKKPTGTITFTIGGDICKLTLKDDQSGSVKEFSCAGETTTYDSLPDTEAQTFDGYAGLNGYIGWMMRNIVLSKGNTTDRIRAEYSGDTLFNPSNSIINMFEAIPTTLVITKVDSLPLSHSQTDREPVDVDIELSWTEDPKDSARIPTGTIKFTLGESACTLDISKDPAELIGCSAANVTSSQSGKKLTVSIIDLEIPEMSGNHISAEYSGDELYQASIYEMKIPTEPEITAAYIAPDGTVDALIGIEWDKTLSGDLETTGTLKVTVGSTVCTLTLPDKNYDNHSYDLLFSDCESDPIDFSHQGYLPYFQIENLKIGDGPADGIKAEYSGDTLFEKSESEESRFIHLNTDLTILEGHMVTDMRADLETKLTFCWRECGDDINYEDMPAGSVTFTLGSDSCKLDLSDGSFSCKDEQTVVDISEKSNWENGGKTFRDWNLKIKNILLADGNKPDRVKAEFSGDKRFNSSSSDDYLFNKVDTGLEITSAYKPNDPGLANSVTIFTWDAEKAANRKPVGTIKYTVGSGSCTLDLSTETMDCDSVEPISIDPYSSGNMMGYKITIENMALSDTNADGIKAEYSGDSVFSPSSGDKVLFKNVDTEIAIRSSFKPDEKHATVTAELNWDGSEADGRTPLGTVKFVVGSGSCTLYLATEQLSCEPGTGSISDDWHTIIVRDMLVDDSSADRVSAEYSGDGFFNPSKSTKVLFDRIDTELKISEAYKTDDVHVSLKGLLSWDETTDVTDIDPLPTGTLTITVGNKAVKYDLETKQFDPEGGSGDVDDPRHNYTFINLPFDDAGAKSVKVEYSGDRYYGSSSAQIDFMKIDTVTVIKNVEKLTLETSFDVMVNALKPPLDGSEPDGTFNVELYFTGSAPKSHVTCKNVRVGAYSQCDDEANYRISVVKRAEGYYNFYLNQRDYPASFNTLIVTYNGNSIFNSSKHTQLESSNAVQTDTEILEAIQLNDGMKYVQLKFELLGSSGNPNGLMLFSTSNGKTCTVNIRSTEVVSDPDSCSKVWSSYNSTTHIYKFALLFDRDKASDIQAVYEGTQSYYGSADSAVFDETSTDPIDVTHLGNTDEGKVELYFRMPFTSKELIGNQWPGGSFVITKGNYTCTVSMGLGHTVPYELDLSSCGGGSARIQAMDIADDYGDKRLMVGITDLNVTDHQTPTIKIKYTGDWTNAPSEVEKPFTDRVDSKLEVKYGQQSDDYYKYLNVYISPAETGQTTATPTGSVTFNFINSGKTCTVYTGDTSEPDYSGCDDYFNGKTVSHEQGYTMMMLGFSPDAYNDDKFDLSYSGDENFMPSGETFQLPPFEVEITPLTDALYDDGGRLYFNIEQNVSRKFPKFPEIYRIEDCDSFPTECRELKHDVLLKVSVRVKNYHLVDGLGRETIEWPISKKITFTAGSEINKSCTPVYDHDEGNDRIYTCSAAASFESIGLKKVTAGLESTWLNKASSVKFPDMVAVKLLDSQLYSTTIIKQPESGEITVGSPVEVEADTTYDGTSIWNFFSGKGYIYYTWSGIDSGNSRIQSCPATGGTTPRCSLTVTSDTKKLVAEFLGNNTYAPSTGLRSVSPASVSLSMQLEP